jgi:hypothetical protein
LVLEEDMRVKTLIMMVMVVAFSLGMFAGCKSAEQKFCGHMQGLLEAAELGDRYSDEECNETIEEIKGECSNADAVFECFLGIDSLEGADACEDVCEEAEEEEGE